MRNIYVLDGVVEVVDIPYSDNYYPRVTSAEESWFGAVQWRTMVDEFEAGTDDDFLAREARYIESIPGWKYKVVER
jgi:hypothetical protein